MKKILFTILLAFFTLISYSQIEEIDEPVPEKITTVKEFSYFIGSLRKIEDEYFIAYRDWNYRQIMSVEYFQIGNLEDVYEFKQILLKVRETKETKRFKIKNKKFTVKASGKKYLSIYIDDVISHSMGNWSLKKIEKLIPKELFNDM